MVMDDWASTYTQLHIGCIKKDNLPYQLYCCALIPRTGIPYYLSVSGHTDILLHKTLIKGALEVIHCRT